MQSIRNLFSAFANVAASLNALAGVIDAATGRLRQQLAAEGIDPAHVIDNQPASEEANGTGRKRKATAG
jgi:hypothetical protein